MVDTVRDLAVLQALLADNTNGDISPQDLRDFLASAHLRNGARPVNGDFSWLNQGSNTINEAYDGSLVLTNPPEGSAISLRGRVKSAPSTPYTITAQLDFAFPSKNFLNAGLFFRESGTGEIATMAYLSNSLDNMIRVQHYSDPNTVDSTEIAIEWQHPPQFWRIADDGTDRTYSVSTDGDTFVEVYSQSRTLFLTADQVGFYVQSRNQSTPNIGCQLRVFSWVEA